jgi:hypothetical protein
MKLKSLGYEMYRLFAEHSAMRHSTAKMRLGDSIQKQSGIYRGGTLKTETPVHLASARQDIGFLKGW